MKRQKSKISYKDSGVDISKADKLIKSLETNNSNNKNIISGIGGFSSLYQLDNRIKDPVIVAGTDGVGTKLKIVKKLKNHKYIGQDLVAMCANDVITTGAKPIFFLDYLATSKISLTTHKIVLKSIQKACNDCSMPLIGGETAEMPGIYIKDDYDLAGFCVGIVSRKKIIHKESIDENDLILGLTSNGLHSNGYSLVNKLIERRRIKLSDNIGNSRISDLLIKPTKLYVRVICDLTKKCKINGLAHITGGGITENVPRVIPSNFSACIDIKSLKVPKLFHYIQEKSKINDEELLKTFNCGIGMIVIINKKELSNVHKILTIHRQAYKILGSIIKKPGKNNIIYVE